MQPPWLGQLSGETFVEYMVSVKAGATLQFSVAVADNQTCTDGVTFRVTVGGTELWQQNVGRTGWQDVVLSLAAYGGSTVPLRLISNPGSAGNPSCDWSLWSQVALVAPGTRIDVPVTMAGGSVFPGSTVTARSPRPHRCPER